MNHTIVNPKGIDKEIQVIQNALFSKLGWPKMDIYGRVHKNLSKDKGYVPEFYMGKNEYKDVFTNDLQASNIFFIDDETHTTDNRVFYFSDVKIVFMVDLRKIKPNINHRADMEVEVEALKVVKQHRMFQIDGFEKGVEAVFKGFNIDHIRKLNIQPYHVFALTGKLKYKINC
ncbi:hypothetical protein [Flavobacterium tructae]|uniref:Uncharacterized protein n=1 Tax=Flavobacterium tructae TaxID=1114873 RepID=A0A1S1J5H5_9FLAO|nr:hypothetical protein [Flavobacterium tructae]OHT44426.1 hypothetical protein BHE19_11945 [Flavobacterium tructae]OXB19438.1 hypothetical protein B0A71_12930 [Flavobacterium tructae]